MIPFINLQGELIPADRPVWSVSNRAFHYGDGLFETFKLVNNTVPFLTEHLTRLHEGMEMLGLQMDEVRDVNYIHQEAVRLARRSRLSEGARIRLSVFREDGGTYWPSTDKAKWVMEAYEANARFELNDPGYRIGVYQTWKKPIHPLGQLKSTNALHYVQAAREARFHEWNEALLLNEHGRIAEGISSNVFFVVNEHVVTPALEEGCLPGVMRNLVIQLLEKGKVEVLQTAIKPELLYEAREVFFTNAIAGIQCALAYDNKRYFHKLSKQLVDAMNQEVDLRINLMMDLQETGS